MSDVENGAYVNWKLLGVVALALGAAAVAWTSGLELRFDGFGEPDETAEVSSPAALSDGAIHDQREALAADRAFELMDDGAEYRVFAWEESDGNWALRFYRRAEGGFHSAGAIVYPSGYDAPRLSGSPPRLVMRNRHLNVDMVFRPIEDGDDGVEIADPG